MDFVFHTHEEDVQISLRDLRSEKSILLVLLRHLGWPCCRSFLAQLREHVEPIEKNGVSIVAVVPTDSSQIKQFLNIYGPYPFQILGDPRQNAYKTLGLRKVSIAKSLKIITEYVFSGRIREIFPKDVDQMRIIKKAMLSQDVYQLGGTWLIDQSGKVLWEHIDSEPSDHAAITTILSELKS